MTGDDLAKQMDAAAFALRDAREKWHGVAFMLAQDKPLPISEVTQAAEELRQAQYDAFQLLNSCFTGLGGTSLDDGMRAEIHDALVRWEALLLVSEFDGSEPSTDEVTEKAEALIQAQSEVLQLIARRFGGL